MKQWTFLIVVVGLLGASGTAGAQVEFELGEQGFEQVAEPAPGADAELQAVREALADEKPGRAIKLASRWIENHRLHPRMPEALLLRADAKIMRKDFFKALYDLEYLVRAYPGSPQFMTALEREFEIARMFARGMKRKLWGMRLISAAGEAEELLIRIQERAPGSDLAERANMELGDYYYRRKEMGLAAEAYDIFLANFPRSLMATKAWQQQIDANLATVRGPRYDATGLYEARQRLGEFKEVYPAAAAEYNADQTLDDIAESLAAKTLIKADWYAGQERPRSAIFLYQRVVEEYPGTEAAEQAQAKLSTYGSEQVQRYSKLPPAVAAQLAEGQTVQPGADELETNAQPVEVEEVEIRPDDLLPTAPETE